MKSLLFLGVPILKHIRVLPDTPELANRIIHLIHVEHSTGYERVKLVQ